MPEPQPTYVTSDGGTLRLTHATYAPIAEPAGRQPVDAFVLPARSGQAWEVPAGHVCRFSIIEGPQVVDLNLWNRDDPRERFWAARTRQFHGAHVGRGDRLWSGLPFLRPLATIVADTVDYGIDEHGAGCHDLLGTRCDPYVNRLLEGASHDVSCHSNIVRAVAPHGLTEFDVHDVINLFQVTGLMPGDERYFMKPCPAQVGDHVELFAEVDLLMAASTCPGGDLAAPLWGPDADAAASCHPIAVETFRVSEQRLADWTAPQRVTLTPAG